jgi:hypothetical protein
MPCLLHYSIVTYSQLQEDLMSAGDTPKEAIPIIGVSTRAAVNAAEDGHISTKYGESAWAVTGRALSYENNLTLEQVDVDLAEGSTAQVYFDLSALTLDEEDDTIRGVWDDNDQRPPALDGYA